MANDSPAKSLVDIDLASLRVSALLTHTLGLRQALCFNSVSVRSRVVLDLCVTLMLDLCVTLMLIVTVLPFVRRALFSCKA